MDEAIVYSEGYSKLFLSFYAALISLPVPNEVLIMSSGVISSISNIRGPIFFIIIYIAVTINTTSLYVVGRLFGNRLIRNGYFLSSRVKASQYIEKYGSATASLCYFIPVVRHMVPFILGLNKYPYMMFAIISYSTAFIWALCLFFIGRAFTTHILTIRSMISFNQFVVMVVVTVIIVISLKGYKQIQQKRL